MRIITAKKITEAISRLCILANCDINQDVRSCVSGFFKKEKSRYVKFALKQIIENYKISSEDRMPLCQDTGLASVFIEIGQEVHIMGGALSEAVNAGVRKGYGEGYFRKSVVSSPLERKNTGDNTPAVIYTEIVPGNKIKITLMPKGAGSENMAALKMFSPGGGIEETIDFIVDTVLKAGANPCPPVIVGAGIGGTSDRAVLLAKKALALGIGKRNPDNKIARLEKEILRKINLSGCGIQGLGGKNTALEVHILTYPCHIASLPVAVNLDCHLNRYKTVIL